MLQACPLDGERHNMKITRRQLRQLVREALEIHSVPDDIATMDPEETYGLGYYKGKEQDAECDRGSKLSGKFADEARSKGAALSAASIFSDSLGDDGVVVDPDTISSIYQSLLGLARDVQK
jgi:hypothetical protein